MLKKRKSIRVGFGLGHSINRQRIVKTVKKINKKKEKKKIERIVTERKTCIIGERSEGLG